MATFFLFGKYSIEGIKDISAERTTETKALIEENGGKMRAAYALMGKYDVVLIVEFPDFQKAMKTSVGLAKLLGIGFMTAPAVTMEEFDSLVG